MLRAILAQMERPSLKNPTQNRLRIRWLTGANCSESGGFAAAQYVFDNVIVQGITLPTKRRAYMRDERLMPIHDRLMVSIDLSDISFS